MRLELSIDIPATEVFLDRCGWRLDGEIVEAVESAGEGNMNRTLRVRTSRRSIILKQSFAYCAKFPEIPAPIERIETEVAFYEIAHRAPTLSARMPKVLAFSAKHHVAMLQDLGAGSDLMALYAGYALAPGELGTLCELALALHELPLAPEETERLRNKAMRVLNHEHIFDLPLQPDNGIDVESFTPGLRALAEDAKRDTHYVRGIAKFGRIYLEAEGPCLLHGDYYPGSLLRTNRGLALIDPEFAFPGPREFDLSVLVAHLVFAGGDAADCMDAVIEGYGAQVDRSLIEGFAAAELMRRTLGVSQLPLRADLDRKRTFLEQSRAWIEAST